MPINTQRARTCLRAFDFKKLFIEELGWNNASTKLQPVEIDGALYSFTPFAEHGGMIIAECQSAAGNIPTSGQRAKIDKYVTQSFFEHILIFTDSGRHTSLWRWVKHEQATANGGKPSKAGKAREHSYRRNQPGDSLLQKLGGIAFSLKDLDDDGKVSIGEVTGRVAKAFDVERVTKKFYDQFKTEHSKFLDFLKGVQDTAGRDWYASVMLNRLMFLYFIQKKGFLDGKPDYLRQQLAASKTRGTDRFYRDFLLVLFFQGLACEKDDRTDAEKTLIGDVPYLNGGLFLPHQIEEANDSIQIADAAFERLFAFFDSYHWHLDDRELRSDNEVNPDVLGYIFEKYINQKQMGAYYTKEDITTYICTYTILPFLLDKIDLHIAQEISEVGPYIYEAVSTDDYLPTETEREHATRRKRYDGILTDFAAGKISTVNDLITYNLNLRQFVDDWLLNMNEPVMLRRFYFEGLLKLTVLDPTCGSGAFLFAAMNILEPLYERCLEKMQQILDGKEGHKYPDFARELERVNEHPNRRYFVLKSIIVNNLYGVDIMDEAVEICKLRLFLKLVAQVDDVKKVEPLPDIDFNIRAGNTLVGFATKAEIDHQAGGTFRLYDTEQVLRKVEDADRAMAIYRDLQTRVGMKSADFKEAKTQLNAKLTDIRTDLDTALMQDYVQGDLTAFRRSHKPFHWYAEFNHVMANGGFDVIVGNPPYVESNKVSEYSIRNYESDASHNLYAYTMERAAHLQRIRGRFGVIVPSGAFSVNETASLRSFLKRQFSLAWLSGYAIRPAKLFDGVDQRLAIYISFKSAMPNVLVYSSRYNHWYSEERPTLFETLPYQDASSLELNGVYPKVGSEIAISVIDKVKNAGKPAGDYLLKTKGNGVLLHYHRSPRYWIRAMDFEQYFKSATRSKSIHHFRDLYVTNVEMAKLIGAVMNSSLYFFWFMTVGNGRNLTGDDVKNLPVGTPTSEITETIGNLFDGLMEDYKKNSVIRVRKAQEYQEFDQSASKPIIDEIDRVLAQHYGFTDEELDFIINYDIKYRMGQGAESDEGEEQSE